VEALVERCEDVAKGWLLELVEQEPLAAARSIRVRELTHVAPAICAALARALASDAELERISPWGELGELVSRAGELAGAGTAEAVLRAVEALRAVLWSALLGSLADPDASLVAELAERLALVCERVRDTAVRRLTGDQGPTLVGVLEARVVGARAAGTSLGLLLVELEDSERMAAVEPSHHAAAIFERLAAAVRAAVGPGELVIADAPARVWVIAPGSDADAAARLGSLIAAAVREGGSWRGAPLRPSIGVAVLDGHAGDATDAAGLIEAAEEASFAAAAAGIEVARTGPSEKLRRD
jgi:GGDEF domain-containing protein